MKYDLKAEEKNAEYDYMVKYCPASAKAIGSRKPYYLAGKDTEDEENIKQKTAGNIESHGDNET